MIGATDVFVSYKAEDRARLLPLISALEAEGFTVWWDAHIGGGAHWREDIQEHLDAAKCVIVVWTRRSVGPGGDFVRDEATRARKRGAYLPVRFDATEPPLGFGEIEAVSLKGWKGGRSDPRFRAIAEAVRRRMAGEDIAHVTVPRDRPSVSRRALLVSGVSVVTLTGVGGWLLFKRAPANARRIAVLPFADLSPAHDQTYFSEGVAEELRSALSRIGLEVIGRSSSDAVKDLDTKTAAAKLRVANILTGSVRRSPETIRVNAQLVGGSDGVERWAQSYDRAPGDAIKIQTDIAASVANALSITLGQAGRAALTLGGTADGVAQDLTLQSRKLVREADSAEAMHRSIVFADAAIARDPRYADAYVAKATALLILAQTMIPAQASNVLAEAEGAARKAMALAPKLGSAHAALANLALERIDFASALAHTKQSLALSPNDLDVLSFASRNIACFVDPQEGLRLVDQAISLDPFNGRLYRRKAEVLTYLRLYPQSIEAGRKALALAPELHNAHLWVGDSLLLLGHVGEAKAEYGAMPSGNPFRMTREALVAARIGDIDGTNRKIAQVRQFGANFFNYQLGEVYAYVRNKDRAFAEFDKAVKAKSSGLIYLKVDPLLDPIRNDPRYASLLRELKFP